MELEITKITCCNCGVLFCITTEHNKELLRSKASFYCPNGHSQSYVGKTDKEKLEEEKERSKKYYDWYRNQSKEVNAQKRKVNSYKGNLAKAKKKIKELEKKNE